MTQGTEFEIVLRAKIMSRGKILLCRLKQGGHFFLPGGHLEHSEQAEVALAREIKEEIGVKPLQVKLLGTVTNQFSKDGKTINELNVLYEVKLKSYKIKSIEDHIEFVWIDRKEISRTNILPKALKKLL